MRRIAAGAVAVTALAAMPLAGAAPTCPDPLTQPACGNRVVAEPLLSTTFLQYGSEAFPALDAIEALAPEVVEVASLDELTTNPAHVSAGGRKIPIVRLTDETSFVPKRKVAIALSIHGTEPAGREGGIRYIEDVARWWASDKSREVWSGDVSFPLSEVMAATEVWLCFCNPDGWADGDAGGTGPTFTRGNDNGTDLNRQFDTMGWNNPEVTSLAEPEAAGWAHFVRGLGKITTASDIHGELTSANDAFSDLMWPADQWTPKEQAQELQLGLNTIKTIERKFEEDGVVLGLLTGATETMTPAQAATGYDVVGYDDAGFLGDWYSQAVGAIDIDAENFLSHMAPGNVWIPALEQAHVAAVRGIIEAVMVESMVTDAVKPTLDLGRVAYVFDPVRVTGGGTGGAKPYDVSRMKYFEDLATAAGKPVTPLDAFDVATADLTAYDTIVLADNDLPIDRIGRQVDGEAYRNALKAFVEGGGQLVMTDSAIRLMSHFGFGNEGDVAEATTNAGHVDVMDHEHEWTDELLPTASQTYYEVPLGYSPESAAPHHGISTEAWEAAGGTVIGTINGVPDPVTDEPTKGPITVLGDLAFGKGKLSIFGALLPRQETANEPKYGLVDYGVTIAGGQIFHSMLSYRRAGAPAVEPPPPPRPTTPPAPSPPPAPGNGGRPTPSTGWNPSPLLLLLPLVAVAGRRRRRIS